MTEYQPPRGTRDFLPEEMIRREWMINTLKNVFERFGFSPLETPAFESWELLSKKGGGGDEIKDEIYYFKDKSERELGLRFDLTVPFARVVASNPQLPKPFKRYQIGRVWRYDRPQAGRFREFWQADIDIAGAEGRQADAECLSVAIEALKALGFSDFVVSVNDRMILSGIIDFADIPKEKIPEVFRVLDKIEKIGMEDVLNELIKLEIDLSKSRKLLELVAIKGDSDKVIADARNAMQGIESVEAGLKSLEKFVSEIKSAGIQDYVVIDFSLIRGLDYYTGPIFEIFIKGFEGIGSVAGGGRYDNLISLYEGRPTPAVGISLGIERIYEVMAGKKMFSLPRTLTKVFVVPVSESVKSNAVKIVQELRNEGINAQTDLMGRDFGKQLEYADSIGVPYALIAGERELKKKKFVLKDMRKREQKEMTLKQIIKELKKA